MINVESGANSPIKRLGGALHITADVPYGSSQIWRLVPE
jgi:hypothetical protein